jgi:hypothetical protein
VSLSRHDCWLINSGYSPSALDSRISWAHSTEQYLPVLYPVLDLLLLSDLCCFYLLRWLTDYRGLQKIFIDFTKIQRRETGLWSLSLAGSLSPYILLNSKLAVCFFLRVKLERAGNLFL